MGVFKGNGRTNIFVSVNALCLIYSKSIAVWKNINTTRHYSSKHKENYKKCAVSEGKKQAALKMGLVSQQNVFRKLHSDSSSALRPSHRVAYFLTKESKPLPMRNL
jgi:hypothetical protein